MRCLRTLSTRCFVLLLAMLLWLPIASANTAVADLATFTENLDKREGYFNLYIDVEQDRVYLEVPRHAPAFIFQSSLPRGVGSNDLGLDRGQLGNTR